MQTMTLSQTADFIETATIEQTHDFGHALVHVGTAPNGQRFVLTNDMHGETSISFGS